MTANENFRIRVLTFVLRILIFVHFRSFLLRRVLVCKFPLLNYALEVERWLDPFLWLGSTAARRESAEVKGTESFRFFLDSFGRHLDTGNVVQMPCVQLNCVWFGMVEILA